MNTFLPFPSFMDSARCLDRQRLGKQRLEAIQLVEACLRGTGGWANHPAARMWKGFEIALCHYGLCCCQEWKDRGYVDKLYAHFQEKLKDLPVKKKYDPPWLGREDIHSAYRAALLFKAPEWYSKYGWLEKPAVPNEKGSLPYVWPV